MLISIDHGNLFIKTPHLRFPSGIVRRYVHPPVTNDVLEYNGAIYSLSNNRLSYQYDKTLDERYYLLTLVAIAKELELVHTTRADVDLAVGLPPEHFGRLRAPFAAYFKKSSDPVTFRFAGKTYTVEIRNVMVPRRSPPPLRSRTSLHSTPVLSSSTMADTHLITSAFVKTGWTLTFAAVWTAVSFPCTIRFVKPSTPGTGSSLMISSSKTY